MNTTRPEQCTTVRQARKAHNEGRPWRLQCVYVGYNADNVTRHSDKFWALEGNGGDVTRRWGKRGTPGRTKADTFHDGVQKFEQKTDKGYRVSVA